MLKLTIKVNQNYRDLLAWNSKVLVAFELH